MIGNLSKHTDEDKFLIKIYNEIRLFYYLKESLEKYERSKKILKGTVYAVGNISYHTWEYFIA